MKILLSSVKESRKTFRLESPLRLDGLEERAEEGQVAVTVVVDPVGDRWVLEAEVRGTFPFRCDRCRRLFDGELEGDFRLIVLAKAVSGIEPGDDAAVVLLPAGSQELDIREQVIEALWLDLPIQLGCDAEGDETCPGHGESEVPEENQAKEAAETAIDPRWGPLANLKQQMEAGPDSRDTAEEEQRED